MQRPNELTVRVAGRIGTLALNADVTTDARVIAIEGPSGAGKSALLRIVAGMTFIKGTTLQIGSEIWEGHGVTRRPAWQRSIAWVPQDALLLPHLTVLENIRYGRAEAIPTEHCTGLARELGIATLLSRRPRHLSGGERQRVALARALLAPVAMLLLDEPFAALDPERRISVRALIRERSEKTQQTILLASHEPADGAGWVDEKWLICDGHVSRG